jgi:N-acyl-phosphatidylethanolamine-hydrolysing phospholipase D
MTRLTAAALLLGPTAPAAAAAGPSEVRVTWVGGPTMVLRFGPIRILTDPVLGEGSEAFRIYDPNVGTPDVAQARLVPLPKVSLDRIDLVLVSHAHEDHLDRTAIGKLGQHAEFLVPPSQLDDVRKRGVNRASGLALGNTRTISRGDYQVTITAVAARHSEDAKLLPILGDVNGYWFEFRHRRYRRTIYWTGDSFAPAGGVPLKLRNPNLFIPHLGGVGAKGPIGHVSMGSSHALVFARDVQPRAILPIHHSTFSLYREPIEPFVDAARVASFKVERLREGDEYRLK